MAIIKSEVKEEQKLVYERVCSVCGVTEYWDEGYIPSDVCPCCRNPYEGYLQKLWQLPLRIDHPNKIMRGRKK